MVLVIPQHGICRLRQCFAFLHAGIAVDCDHVRPVLEVFLSCRRELVLFVLRPAMEILYLPEGKSRRGPILRWRQGDRPAEGKNENEKPVKSEAHQSSNDL